MKLQRIYIDTIEMLLNSVTLEMGEDGAEHSFLFGRPGSPHWEHRLGATIYYHPVEINLTALHVRSSGPRYLRALPLGDICAKLKTFLSENFWHIGNAIFGCRDSRPLSVLVPEEHKLALATALSTSSIFEPEYELTLFPLVPVRVDQPIATDAFFFVSATNQDLLNFVDTRVRNEIEPTCFPPQKRATGPRNQPTSWLGVTSPDYRAAIKIRSAILGAVALTQMDQYRHTFSGRSIFGGRCTIGKSNFTYSFEEAHTPKCMNEIKLTGKDTGWLETLSDKLLSEDKTSARQSKALEYFYRAWPKTPEERFPILCMALDAIYGEASNATQAVIDGVRATLGDHVSEPQLRSIMKLRASVIHGGAPDVYDSRKYAEHYRKFGCDPIRDLQLVVAACLRRVIFTNGFAEHEDPNSATIAKAIAAGRFPPMRTAKSILAP